MGQFVPRTPATHYRVTPVNNPPFFESLASLVRTRVVLACLIRKPSADLLTMGMRLHYIRCVVPKDAIGPRPDTHAEAVREHPDPSDAAGVAVSWRQNITCVFRRPPANRRSGGGLGPRLPQGIRRPARRC